MIAICIYSLPVWAQIDRVAELTTAVQKLQQQVEAMNKIIEAQGQVIQELRYRPVDIKAAQTGQNMKDSDFQSQFDRALQEKIGTSNQWLKDLNFSGDLRLRAEHQGFSHGSAIPSDSDRNRFRYRMRYGFEKDLPADTKIGFFMASGDRTDPTSSNQTIGDNWLRKEITFDRVYAVYSPEWAMTGPFQKTDVTAGKMANPFLKGSSALIWDNDVRPEGLAEQTQIHLFKTDRVDANAYMTAGQFVLQEDAGSYHAEMYGFQGGIMPKLDIGLANPAELHSSGSWYFYPGFSKHSNFIEGSTSYARNNLNLDGWPTSLDAGDFSVVSFYNEIMLPVLPDGIPLSLFNDNALNTSTVDYNHAWSLGAKIGKLRKKGDWEVGYEYRLIQPNAIVGAFSEADFGLGYTDKRGSVIEASYKLTDNLSMRGGLFFVNNVTGDIVTADQKQRKYQLDLCWIL